MSRYQSYPQIGFNIGLSLPDRLKKVNISDQGTAL